ncbi:MAG: enoyl-CoA hydratase-related protein, partial [Actinomycetota bacterium]
ADIRIAHPDTKMSVREVHWGLVPDMTGTFMLSKLARPDVARELTYTARVFTATEGHELGLVTQLSDDPLAVAEQMARDIAGRSPGAVRGAKAAFNRLDHEGAAEAFAEERRQITAQIGTPNQVESVMAGFENRTPVFQD